MQCDLQTVRDAIKAGDKQKARELLRPLLKQPTADTLYLASLLCKKADAERYLREALTLQPDHPQAQRRLSKLMAAAEPEFVTTASQSSRAPQADPIIWELPSMASLTALPSGLTEADLPPLKSPRPPRRRSPWTYIGCSASIVLSLTLSYITLLLLGSSLPGQIRSVISQYDPRVIAPEGTLVYATPAAFFEGTPLYTQPLAEIDATPITAIDGTPVYARPDAVTVVQPVISKTLQWDSPLSEVLEPGYAHEYTFTGVRGDELAIAIQFFSPFAQRVGRNVRLIDPEGSAQEESCIRDNILGGDTGVAFICTIHSGGEWKLRIFGREGESSGAYVVAIERF